MHRHLGVTVVIPFVVAWTAAALHAQEAGTQPQPAPSEVITDEEFHLPFDDETAAKIDELIPLLGSPEFAKRELASARLTEIGASTFAKLRDAFHRSDDLEVRLRIERLVRESYINRHVFARFGFLGIQRRRGASPTHGDDPRIPKGDVGIAIEVVRENTAAERAGLQPGDIIIALDGTHFQGDSAMAFELFARAIRAAGAGGRISLTVLRAEEVKQIVAILGRPPREGINLVTGLQQSYDAAARRLEVWWYKYFRSPPKTPPHD